MADETIPVRLFGRDLLWLKNDDGTGALAPPEHIDENGNVASFQIAFTQDAYAHVYEGGIIKRYGEEIGTVDDIEFRPSPETTI